MGKVKACLWTDGNGPVERENFMRKMKIAWQCSLVYERNGVLYIDVVVSSRYENSLPLETEEMADN